jgi:hypothetical protein
MNGRFSFLGSARASRAVFGALAEKPLPRLLSLGEAPSRAREGARAPQI